MNIQFALNMVIWQANPVCLSGAASMVSTSITLTTRLMALIFKSIYLITPLFIGFNNITLSMLCAVSDILNLSPVK